MIRIARDRRVFGVLLITAVVLGLASRRFRYALPAFIAEYAGDTLWATTVFLALALIFPRQRTSVLAAGAIVVAVLVECSQLLHAPWLDAMRHTRLGALALGQGFLWSDLACYVVGVVIGVAIDNAERRVKV